MARERKGTLVYRAAPGWCALVILAVVASALTARCCAPGACPDAGEGGG